MRLIDADEVLARIENPYQKAEIARWLRDAPTIERKKGKWLFPYGDKKYKRCSVCERDYYSIPHNSNFCPNCGADMRGEQDG